jgi:hypothetical protein
MAIGQASLLLVSVKEEVFHHCRSHLRQQRSYKHPEVHGSASTPKGTACDDTYD